MAAIVRKGKGIIRSLNKKAAVSGKQARRPTSVKSGALRFCEGCGAAWLNRTWRRDHHVTLKALDEAEWGRCPACIQVDEGEYFGRVSLRGGYLRANEAAIRRRLGNVVARAEFTQPQRRLVSIEAVPDGVDVLTTSQKLAHRIVTEIKKAFGGRAAYRWSDDGTLFAVWSRAE